MSNYQNRREGIMRAHLLQNTHQSGTCMQACKYQVFRDVITFLSVIVLMASSALGTVIHVPGDQPTIQDGIRTATDGDTVLVAPGMHIENINFRGKNIVVASHYILDQDPDYIETTIIDGSNPAQSDSASCVIMCSGEDSTAILQGFTLTGGTGTRWFDDLFSQMFWRAGGGVYTYKSSPTIKNNLITNNAVTDLSGVNGAQGGGLLCYYGNPLISDNMFTLNQANYGAGFVTDYSGARIKRNLICHNTAGESYGGGAYFTIGEGPAPVIIENNTIVYNSSESNGGAIALYGLVPPTMVLRNNIIWGNTQNRGNQIEGNHNITYSAVEGGYPGQGNIEADPQFEDEAYNLSQGSPCIDSGDPDSPLDPDGTRADMGARAYLLMDAPLIRFLDYDVDDSQGNNNGRADASETVHFIATFHNTRLDATGVSATLSTDDPDVQMIETTSDFGNLPRDGNTTNEANPFILSVNANSVAHPAMFHLDITADGGYADSDSFETLIGTSSILLIDDDEGDVYEEYYLDGLRIKQIFPEEWVVALMGPPEAVKMQQYEAVIWFTGDDRESCLTPEEQSTIAGFLDEGGNLVISGPNIGYDLVEDGSTGDASFFADYLHAEYISDDITETFAYGVEGDPITGQYTFLPLEESQTSPDVIAPLDGASTILTYQSTQQTAALKYENDYKIVYFALGLESIGSMGGTSNEEVRGTLLQNCINWFNYAPTAGDVNQDGTINVLDVLSTINIILNVIQPTPGQEWAADCNGDETVNILDALGIVNVVLGIGTCP